MTELCAGLWPGQGGWCWFSSRQPLCLQRHPQQPQAGSRAAGSQTRDPPAPDADPAAGGHVPLQRGGESRASAGRGRGGGRKEAGGSGESWADRMQAGSLAGTPTWASHYPEWAPPPPKASVRELMARALELESNRWTQDVAPQRLDARCHSELAIDIIQVAPAAPPTPAASLWSDTPAAEPRPPCSMSHPPQPLT